MLGGVNVTAPPHVREPALHVVDTVLSAPAALLIARIALTCPFWIGGMMKLIAWDAALAEMTHFGLMPAPLFAASVAALQLSASLAIIVDRFAWLAAGALGLFTLAASIMAHDFWNYVGQDRVMQANTFLEHLAIIAGLVLAAMISRADRPV